MHGMQSTRIEGYFKENSTLHCEMRELHSVVSFWMLCLETSEVNVKEQNSNNISVKNKH